MNSAGHVSWRNEELVPAGWCRQLPATRYFVFNPGLIWTQGRYVMVYRVVAPRYATQRLALCELDADLRVLPGSVRPLSDELGAHGDAATDPRCTLHDGRLLVWYTLYRELPTPALLEMDAAELRVLRPPRLLLLDGPRRRIEKNWMPFNHEGDLYVVYSIWPHVVLRLDLARDDAVVCRPLHTVNWDATPYARRWGEPRGGAPPLRWGDRYVSVFHSSRPRGIVYPAYQRLRDFLLRRGRPGVEQEARLRDPRLDGAAPPADPRVPRRGVVQRLLAAFTRRFARLHYYAGVYTFAATPPFAPIGLAPDPVLYPLDEAPPQRTHDRLRPVADRVVFVCGAQVTASGTWLLSYGVHDERCVLREVDAARFLARCRPVNIHILDKRELVLKPTPAEEITP